MSYRIRLKNTYKFDFFYHDIYKSIYINNIYGYIYLYIVIYAYIYLYINRIACSTKKPHWPSINKYVIKKRLSLQWKIYFHNINLRNLIYLWPTINSFFLIYKGYKKEISGHTFIYTYLLNIKYIYIRCSALLCT